MLALTDHAENPELILTLRAGHLSSHSGEVALPGGKWEPGDRGLAQTALRESWEEVSLDPAQVQMLGALQPYNTRQGLRVTPFVGVVPAGISLVANPDEIAAIFHVPLLWFRDEHRIRTDIYRRGGELIWSPAYDFEGFEIWGFTARVVTDFLRDYAGISARYDAAAPVKDWGVVG